MESEGNFYFKEKKNTSWLSLQDWPGMHNYWWETKLIRNITFTRNTISYIA